MSNMSSDCRDIESQQRAWLITGDRRRDNWRWIFLVLQARQILISRASKTKRGSLGFANAAVSSSTSSSYAAINTCNEGNVNSEITEIVEELPTSPQVSVHLFCDDPIVSNVKLQHANIAQIVKARDLAALHKFGGVQGIAIALDTDLEKGILGDENDLCSRRIRNTLSNAQDPARSFAQLVLKSCNNYIVILFLLSAVMSIGFGIKQEGGKSGWRGGVIIISAVIVLVVASSIRDFWRQNSMTLPKEHTLSEKSQTEIDVIRGGQSQRVFISDVVIGDIVCLRRGYNVPCDGLFISGESLKLGDGLAAIDEQNPFLFYGSKVIKGHGRMLATSVGMNTAWGEMMSQITQPSSQTPLPAQLDKVSIGTQIFGLLISILIPVVVFLHFELRKEKHHTGMPDIKDKPTSIKELMEAMKRIIGRQSGKVSLLTTLVTLVVGIVEGVPFIITLAIFYWNKKALSYKAFAQELLACISMGSVTTICTDTTGLLTLNPHEVCIGEELINEDVIIHELVLEALCNGISTPLLTPQVPISTTENFLLSWATLKLGAEKEIFKQSCTLVDAKNLSSGEEGSRVLIKKSGDTENHMWLHWRGPAKMILGMCSCYYDSNGKRNIMDAQKRSNFEQVVERMESRQLKTMAFAYKKVDASTLEDNSLTLIGLLGLKHICCTDTKNATKNAIEACRNAGIDVKLISEDKTADLEGRGFEFGLLPNSDRPVLEAEDFRKLTNEERLEVVDKISVIGNALPSDKLLLVQCLKQKGHMVAMIGVKTNETPALKEANVGIAMSSWSTELARECSDIIIWDGNFSSLVSIFSCGRCAYENIQKYIQLEVTMVIAWLLITAVQTVVSGDTSISAIQWSWANLLVSVLGGLASLTEPQRENLMDRQPMRRTDPLITKTMWRSIITQALSQTAILVTLQLKSKSVLGISKKVSEIMIFNSFMLCQVFNQFNARQPKMKNIVKGIFQNLWFWVALCAALVLQAAFIEIAHVIFRNAKLNGEQWGISFLIGMLTLPIDFATKSIATFIMY